VAGDKEKIENPPPESHSGDEGMSIGRSGCGYASPFFDLVALPMEHAIMFDLGLTVGFDGMHALMPRSASAFRNPSAS
jgi:hypothetical protein